MSSEVTAALVGGVMGSTAMALFTHWQKVAQERKDVKAVYDLFKHFHDNCMDVVDQRVINFDHFQNMVPNLNDMGPFVLQKGSTTVQKAYFDYLTDFGLLRGHLHAGHHGLTRNPISRMKKTFQKCEDELAKEAILTDLGD